MQEREDVRAALFLSVFEAHIFLLRTLDKDLKVELIALFCFVDLFPAAVSEGVCSGAEENVFLKTSVLLW